MTIKYFFPEGRFAASVGAMLSGKPSEFSVVALEDSKVLSYDFAEFKKLTEKYRDIAAFYIRYMERHWILEKEPLEISFRYDNALKRYNNFLGEFPGACIAPEEAPDRLLLGHNSHAAQTPSAKRKIKC